MDITPALSAAFAIKDPEELVGLRMSYTGLLQLLTQRVGLYPQCFQGLQWPDVGILCRRNVSTTRRGKANDTQGACRKGGWED